MTQAKPHPVRLAGAVVIVAGIGLVSYSHLSAPAPDRTPPVTLSTATVRIDAPDAVCWTAQVAGASHDGCGMSFLPDHDTTGVFSSGVQKQTGDSLPLTITLVIAGADAETNTTSAPYGVATVAHAG